MSFADNLQQIRKENHLSQEELAELLNVSRQAISKWEQGVGYPEVEKLLVLSRKLNISLDALMAEERAVENSSDNSNLDNNKVTGIINIYSPTENITINCSKVMSSQKYRGLKNSPQYALFGANGDMNYWGQTSTFLGWYADEESISKEVKNIQTAITGGLPTYELQFSVKTERKWLSVRMKDSSKESM